MALNFISEISQWDTALLEKKTKMKQMNMAK